MATKLLTKERVAQAKQELEEAGERVTSKSIRDHLGFGSYTTAKDLLEDVLAEEAVLEPAPEVVAAALSGAADKIWAAALDKAMENFRAQEALLMTRAEQAEALAAERLDVIVELEEAQAEWEAENARLREAIAEAAVRFKDMRSRIAELDKDLAVKNEQASTLQRILEFAFGKHGRNGTNKVGTETV